MHVIRAPEAPNDAEHFHDGAAIPGLDIVAELGRGEQAVVYRVRRDDSDFALKLLRPTDDETRAAVAFRREAGLAACVNHPGIARVHEVGEVAGRPYLVMDLVEGDSLAKLIASGWQDQARTVSLAIDVASALAAAHRVGVVHRDVKPHNIVVSPSGQARLIDFGLAAQPSGRLAGDTVAGTVAYAAPEQTGMLKRPVDGRADLYGLGVVMFECVTGARPFTAEDPAELIRLHGTTPAPDIRRLRPDAEPALADVIAKLLAKDPDDRYQTGEGLLADLQQIEQRTDGQPFPLGEDDWAIGHLRLPLAGRQGELGRLTELWRRVCAGRGALAVIDGPVGIGKTRLVEELLDRAESGGAVALRATSVAGDPVPMSALRSSVEQYLCGADRLDPVRRRALVKWLNEAAGTAKALLGPLSPTLSKLLHLGWSTEERTEDQLGTAVATFLLGLARVSGGLILHLDRADALDPASQRVVRQLAAEASTAPILLVCTSGTEPGESSGAVSATTGRWSPTGDGLPVDLHITLGPMADTDVATLAQAQLGGAVLADELRRQLTTRVRGNPGMLLEYLSVMIESGAAYPSWGTWALDRAALGGLDLSSDARALLRRRVDGLAPAARQILTAAAAVPVPFTTSLLADICEMDRDHVATALESAISYGVLTGGVGATYGFLHDLFIEALLASLTDDERQALDHRVNRALESSGWTGPTVTYAIARLYTLGDPDRDPTGMFHACYRAGRLALTEDAAPEAANLLALAAGAAERAGIDPDSQFYRTAGLAAARVGRYDEARRHYAEALSRESDPMHRADILVLVARTHQGDHAPQECLAAVRAGLAEIGSWFPLNPLLLTLVTVVAAVLGIRAECSRPGRLFGTAEGETLRRYRLQARLYEAGAAGADMEMRPALAFAFRLHSLFPANRAGSVPEYVRHRAALGAWCHALGARRPSRRLYRSAQRLAAMKGDPGLAAHVARVHAAAEDLARGVDSRSGRATQKMIERHGRWLELDEYVSSVAALGTVLALRGYAKEALGWYDRGRARLADSTNATDTPFAVLRLLALATLGRLDEAIDELDADSGSVGPLMARLQCGVEGASDRDLVESTVHDAERLRLLIPRKVWPPYRFLWVYQAFGRLAQARLASVNNSTNAQEDEAVALATDAVRQLRRAANSRVLRAHYYCAQASLLQLIGRSEQALPHLARADQLAHRLDLPWLTCEIATVRARALAATGDSTESRRQAKIAYLLAADYGWTQRCRAIRLEFDAAATSMTATDTTRLTKSASNTDRRRLTALQEISAAAATVTDPRELARVALDEIIRILGAERALLFLVNEDDDVLMPHLGRDAAGNDLDESNTYGSTLVERVRQTREPLVIAGSEQGAALGSESVVVHGLRSIMVAPLQLKGRLLGVIYLDNRIAKGVFTVGDVDILTAITHLIAGSLETARTAQLERDIHAAQQQRDLAELMRSAVTDVGCTLDPREVLSRLAGTLGTLLSSDRACLLRPTANGVVIRVLSDHTGSPEWPADPSLTPATTGLMAAGSPVLGSAATLPSAFAGLFSDVRCWLSIPLIAREESVGLLFVASRTMTGFDDAQANIAAALAGQTMIAYDNALLFSRVEQLATTDPLCGISNRRHFFELAGRQVRVAARGDRPLAGVMLDIDHFKRINDTYGHAVGDDVIRAVATRLTENLRGIDILGRYGGEEFAVVLPDVDDEVLTIAERIRATIAANSVHTAAGPVPVTISVGVAQLAGRDDDLDELLARADAALYRAKQNGRNQVVLA